MSTVFPRAPATTGPAPARLPRSTHAVLCIAPGLLAAAAVLAFATPQEAFAADAELARLLRGMALIKGLLTLPVLALVAWRSRSPMRMRFALAYGLGLCAMAVAAASIWRLDHVGAAAALFHAGALSVLLAAWRDDMPIAGWTTLLRRRRGAVRPPAP